MANDSFKVKKGLNIEPNTAPNLSTDGDIGFNSTDSNLEVYTGGSVKKIITNSQTQTLTNKTIDAANNTITGVMSNPMTTGGDIVYGGASGTPTRLANGSANQYLASAGGTAAPVWTSFVAPTVQSFTAGSGTYTLPTSPRSPVYIEVELIGAGGGGSGSGTAGAGNGGTGGATTFGTTLLSGSGGAGGAWTSVPGVGGAASLGTGPVGLAIPGGRGGGAFTAPAVGYAYAGGIGGASAFGGAGSSSVSSAGTAGSTNSGAGGGGGGYAGAAANGYSGTGGGSGGYVKAIITSPSSTYAYAVGAAGTAGTAGTNGTAGGAGAAGIIIVREYYQ